MSGGMAVLLLHSMYYDGKMICSLTILEPGKTMETALTLITHIGVLDSLPNTLCAALSLQYQSLPANLAAYSLFFYTCRQGTSVSHKRNNISSCA